MSDETKKAIQECREIARKEIASMSNIWPLATSDIAIRVSAAIEKKFPEAFEEL